MIYDAEDRPDPDQLKKVVVAFSKTRGSLVCIQGKLNYFNRDQNLLTRWFAAEYAMWFDLVLPGLHFNRHPIPLGGTSNHFITGVLRELGAWDPFNVTEDADLGIRLWQRGYATAMVDSITLEEANSRTGTGSASARAGSRATCRPGSSTCATRGGSCGRSASGRSCRSR